MASALGTVDPPPASAYTTGIYIALGVFLFFGVLCAFVTSPAMVASVKKFFRLEQPQEQQNTEQ